MKLPECKFKQYIFVVTGMSYIIDSSGTSKVVKAHEEIFKSHGIGYVAIFPISRSGGQGAEWHVKTTGCYAFIINGRFVHVMTATEVLNALQQLQKEGKLCTGILIHHVIRNDIHEIQWILSKIQHVPVIYYLHDFYTCCINPNMLKNDNQTCVDGGVSCEGCCYAEKRKKHLQIMKNFLSSFGNRLEFIAPSDYVKERWAKYYPEYKEKVAVIPHQKCVGEYLGNKEPLRNNEPVRLGFVGSQIHVKGWDIFKKTIAMLQKHKCNYEYYYFGNGKEELSGVTNIKVDIASMGKDAMIEALKEKRISAVFLVCVWGETYSYTMYESHAANSYILTMKESGNIAYTVNKENWGLVFDNEEDLISMLLDETKFRTMVNEWKINAKPGPQKYLDNDAILQMFPTTTNVKIQKSEFSESIMKRAKRSLLHYLFVLTRLRNGNKLNELSV